MTYTIQINNQYVQIGSTIPSQIYSLIVYYDPAIVIGFPKEHKASIEQWFNKLIDSLTCDYVTFNGILIPTSELNKF